MTRLPCLGRFPASLPATLVASGFLFAQAQAPLPKGQVVAQVPCRTDPAQSYALYLPSNYGPEKPWPILYAFDPGARGSVPVEDFQGAAEEYGYIVVGPNNSRNAALEAEYLGVFDQVTNAIRTAGGSPPEIAQMIQRMQLSECRGQAEANKDTEESIAAERFVRRALVHTFEQARDALARKDFRTATLYLQITVECAPDSPNVYYMLARAYALNKENKNALAALRKAVEKGYADRDAIEKNADFEALRSLPGYAKLIEQLKKGP